MTTLGRSLVFILAALMLTAGYVTTAHAGVTRYTWIGDESKLAEANFLCMQDIKKSHIPIFGAGPVVRTLYKDCVEKYGYVQAHKSEDGPELIYTYEVVDGVGYQRYRLGGPCGAPNQTCLWRAPKGALWGIVPLPPLSFVPSWYGDKVDCKSTADRLQQYLPDQSSVICQGVEPKR